MGKKENSETSVYIKLKSAIRKRYIKQGSKLGEIVLAKKLGVSRTPVRSAIKKLEAEGLVTTIPNRGAFVITPTQKEIKETFLVRAELECMAARLAAQNIDKEKLKELKELVLHEKEIYNETDVDEYYTLNDSLHLKIAENSGNTVLSKYIKELLDKSRIYLILYDPFYRLEYSPTTEHIEIIDAIAEKNGEKACVEIRKHINSFLDRLHSTGQLPEDYLSV